MARGSKHVQKRLSRLISLDFRSLIKISVLGCVRNWTPSPLWSPTARIFLSQFTSMNRASTGKVVLCCCKTVLCAPFFARSGENRSCSGRCLISFANHRACWCTHGFSVNTAFWRGRWSPFLAWMLGCRWIVTYCVLLCSRTHDSGRAFGLACSGCGQVAHRSNAACSCGNAREFSFCRLFRGSGQIPFHPWFVSSRLPLMVHASLKHGVTSTIWGAGHGSRWSAVRSHVFFVTVQLTNLVTARFRRWKRGSSCWESEVLLAVGSTSLWQRTIWCLTIRIMRSLIFGSEPTGSSVVAINSASMAARSWGI